MCGSLFVPLPLLLWPFFICPSTYSCWLPFWYLKTDTNLCNEKFVSNVRRCLLFNIKWTVFQLHSRREQAYKKYFNTTTKMSLGLRIWAKLLAICCRQKKDIRNSMRKLATRPPINMVYYVFGTKKDVLDTMHTLKRPVLRRSCCYSCATFFSLSLYFPLTKQTNIYVNRFYLTMVNVTWWHSAYMCVVYTSVLVL